MKKDDTSNSLILLESPFLKTSKAKIDMDSGTLTMEFYCHSIEFSVFGDKNYSVNDYHGPFANVVSKLMQDTFELKRKKKFRDKQIMDPN
ncbi:hypothetical protein PTKIN_Ptkin14bG0049400 [Pterospermum kingtungense]